MKTKSPVEKGDKTLYKQSQELGGHRLFKRKCPIGGIEMLKLMSLWNLELYVSMHIISSKVTSKD